MTIENTGQVQLTDWLGRWISKYAADERFTRYVEIGTWNGRGSTYCLYDGFKQRTTPYTLQSYEISKQRIEEARGVWKHVPEMQIIHGRVLQNEECPTYDRVKELFSGVNSSWHKEDVDNFWSCPYVPMNDPEVVLLDGAEYLTWFEYESMKSIASIRVYLLDDIHSDKCARVFADLYANPEWSCIGQGNERNGWAVFEKTARNPTVEVYRQLVKTAHENAERGQSKVAPEILAMDGMTGTKTRHFYNNMLTMEDSRYLEIGPWKGSSVCSAMCGNKATVVVIDNWSEFGSPKDEFLHHFNRWMGENDARFLESDSFRVDVSALPKFNIYMYDGNHDEQSHYDALAHYYAAMDDVFLFIVDDWHAKHIRDGTFRAIKDLNLRVLNTLDLRYNLDNTQTAHSDGWWNGMWVAILEKTPRTEETHHSEVQ